LERSEFREIDHLVLPVTTLALARSRLTSLGFTVAPDARHPFGTGNCCVFFKERNFLEPVTILDRAAADMAAAEGILFVKRLKRFTERNGEGFAMIAIKSDDATADLAAFERAGLAAGPLFGFARMAALPDGSEQEIGFALAFADVPTLPDATFFACQHLAPGALFQPAFLEHPNGALGIASVTAVAHDPAEFGEALAAVLGGPPPETMRSNRLPHDGPPLRIATPESYRARYGVEPPDLRRGLAFAAIDLSVSDLDLAVGFAGPTAIRHDERIVVPPSPGLGTTLAFGMRENG
jgi:hypothetical protein